MEIIMCYVSALVSRYTQFIKDLRPDVLPLKNSCSLDLSNALWLLNKIKEDGYNAPLSWIIFIQASLYHNGLIDLRHEMDISIDILKQEQQLVF